MTYMTRRVCQVVVLVAMSGTWAKALLRARNRALYLRLRGGIVAALAIVTCWCAHACHEPDA